MMKKGQAGEMLLPWRFNLRYQRKTARDRYETVLADPYYPHDWEEASALAAEWGDAGLERREVLATEAETLLSLAYRY